MSLPQGLFFQLFFSPWRRKKACLIDMILISSPGFKVFLQIAINFCLQEISMTAASLKHVRLPMIPWAASTLTCMPLFVRRMGLVPTGGARPMGNVVSRGWNICVYVKRPLDSQANWTATRHGQTLFASCILIFSDFIIVFEDWKAECKVAENI